jgi:hypothetical protein
MSMQKITVPHLHKIPASTSTIRAIDQIGKNIPLFLVRNDGVPSLVKPEY